MVQKTSPFIESKYGWNLGESGWNTGADENFLKFAFMLDNGVDGVVTSLPQTPVNGSSYYLTTDNRFYFVVDGTYYSSPCPKWFTFKLKSSGQKRIYDGSSVITLPSDIDVSAILNQSITNDSKIISDLASASGSSTVGFSQDATGSIPRKVSNKLKETVYVEDFGAVANTLTDSADAIQAALNSGARNVLLNSGAYRSTKTLNFKFNGQKLIGRSVEATTLVMDTQTLDGIVCSSLSGCGLNKLKITGSGNTDGSLVAVEGSQQFFADEIRIQNGYNGIRFNRINACKMERFVIADCSGISAVQFSGDTTFKSDVLNLLNGEISHGNNPNIYGIHWKSYAHSLTLTNVRVIKGGRGLFAENSSGDLTGNSYPSFLQIIGSEFDFSNKECMRLDCMRDAWITNLYCHGSSTANNIFIGSDTVGIRLCLPRSASAFMHGIYLAGKAIEIIGGHFYTNSLSGNAQYDGIHVASTTNGLQIAGVISGNFNDGSSPTQAYGLNIEAGSTNIFYNGQFAGNITANINAQDNLSYDVGNTFRHQFKNASGVHFEVGGSATVANNLRVAGASTGASPQIIAQGSDTNIDLQLTAKGSGSIKFGTFTSNADAAVVGYVTIKDGAGNVRKLAVIA